MLSDSAKKQFQYVIVWKLDRFARNRFDSAVHKAALKKHGVKVLSAMKNIADNPEGLLLEGILESMAEQYSNSLYNIDDIAAGVVASYNNEFNDARIKKMEQQVKTLDIEVDKLVNLLLEMPKKAAAKIGEKIEVLET